MPKYQVTVTHHIEYVVEVEASDAEKAEHEAECAIDADPYSYEANFEATIDDVYEIEDTDGTTTNSASTAGSDSDDTGAQEDE